MRPLAAVILVGAVAGLVWRTFRVKWHRSFPPASSGLTPAQARGLASALAVKDHVESADLDVDFAPSWASLELVMDGARFFPRILDDIDAAESSIHVSQFEFRPGLIGSQFAALLKKKARGGAEVRLILDRLGSALYGASQDMINDLVEAGVQIVQNDTLALHRRGLVGGHRPIEWRLDELAHADHRKLFVIDGRIAWVGSAGVADHFCDGRFHDVFVRAEGEVVGYLQTVFLTSFRFLGGPLPWDPVLLASYYPQASSRGTASVAVLHNVPQVGHLANTDAIAELIDTAADRIDIVCPYTADRGMLERLMSAARRGVPVRFIAPARSSSWATAAAFEHFIARLQSAGVQVWLHPVFPHAKVVLADDRVLVGSTNMDAWALYRNWEIGLLIDDRSVAEVFRRQLFDPDVAASSRATAPTNPLVRARNRMFAAIGPLI